MTEDKIRKEIEGILYLYKVKDIIRYDHKRQEDCKTESVAEHIYGMMVLANIFLPLEYSEGGGGHRKSLQDDYIS